MNFSITRILLALVLGFVLAAAMTEVGYALNKRENRPPKVIELRIPAGTAESIRKGNGGELGIPKDMTFVVGDTLKVINEDTENHVLGPLWIPAGSSASMQLGTEEHMSFECSFQPTNYFGVTVQESVTWGTRLWGIFVTGLPMGIVFAVYSGLVWKKKNPGIE